MLCLPKSVFALNLNVPLRKDLPHCAVVLDLLVAIDKNRGKNSDISRLPQLYIFTLSS